MVSASSLAVLHELELFEDEVLTEHQRLHQDRWKSTD